MPTLSNTFLKLGVAPTGFTRIAPNYVLANPNINIPGTTNITIPTGMFPLDLTNLIPQNALFTEISINLLVRSQNVALLEDGGNIVSCFDLLGNNPLMGVDFTLNETVLEPAGTILGGLTGTIIAPIISPLQIALKSIPATDVQLFVHIMKIIGYYD